MKLNSEPFSGFGKEAFYSVNTIKRMRLVGLGGVTDHIYILYIFIYIYKYGPLKRSFQNLEAQMCVKHCKDNFLYKT